jgi:hypothetical protein
MEEEVARNGDGGVCKGDNKNKVNDKGWTKEVVSNRGERIGDNVAARLEEEDKAKCTAKEQREHVRYHTRERLCSWNTIEVE